jgi:hypothetical protein
LNSAFASASSLESWYRSQAFAASTLAASTIPFLPIVVPPQATACHEWAGVPGTQQAVENPLVGTCHDTSPTSVEPIVVLPLVSNTRPTSSTGGGLSVNDSRRRTANFVSSPSYFRSFNFVRLSRANLASVSLGSSSIVPPRLTTSSRVSVARAPAWAHFNSRG